MNETRDTLSPDLEKIISEVEQNDDPLDLLRSLSNTFGSLAVLGTSGQPAGAVMIDMSVKAGLEPRVFILETGRLHKETLEYLETLEKTYAISIERVRPDQTELKNMISQHGEYLFFDSKAKQEYCCKIRKVNPLNRYLEDKLCWITGIRKDQSRHRETAARLEIVPLVSGKKILKACPLIDWNESQLEEYIEQHKVPLNPLLDKGYKSIGCEICSTPVLPHEHPRAGRWRWFNAEVEDEKKECGIHLPEIYTSGSGI